MLGLKCLVPLAVVCLVTPPVLAAQDAFETEVYQYQTAEPGEWELEAQLNYVADGTTLADGTVAPTDHQAHAAFEVTHGITRLWEVGAYLLSAVRPDVGVQYAGWRVRTRVRAPERWHLPVDVSLGAELEFTQPAYDESASGFELRPTFGRRFGRWQLDFNPVLEHSLNESETGQEAEGWEFEPSARVGVSVSRSVNLALEYYGKTGIIGNSLPKNQQVHMFYPSIDLKLGDDFAINLGVGFGTTDAWNQLVFKSRFEVPLGR